MTRMTGPDCVVMCNLINTYIHTYIHFNKYIHTYIHTYIFGPCIIGVIIMVCITSDNEVTKGGLPRRRDS